MPGMSSRSEQASNQPVNKQKLNWHTWVQEKEQANNDTTLVKSIRLTQVTNKKHSLRTPPNCLLGSPHTHTISVEGLSLWWHSSMRCGCGGGWLGWGLLEWVGGVGAATRWSRWVAFATMPAGFLVRLVSHALVMPRPARFI